MQQLACGIAAGMVVCHLQGVVLGNRGETEAQVVSLMQAQGRYGAETQEVSFILACCGWHNLKT